MKFKPFVVFSLALSSFAGSISTHAEIQVVRKVEPETQNQKQNPSAQVASQEQAVLKQVATQQVITQQRTPRVNYGYSVLAVVPHNNHALGAPIPKRYISQHIYLRNPPSYVQCFYTSSQKYGVPVDLMMAIAQTESSFKHQVTGKLGYGADHGLMQINDYWIPTLMKKFGISLNDIYNPCTNIEVAAWILAHNFVQHGTTWRAVGAYNAVTEWKREVYIKKVANNLKRLQAGQL